MIVNTSKEQAFVTGTENNGHAFKPSEAGFKQASAGDILGLRYNKGHLQKKTCAVFLEERNKARQKKDYTL